MPLTTSSSSTPSGVIVFAAALLRSALRRGLRSDAPARAWGRLHRPWRPLWHPPWRPPVCHLGVVVVVVVVSSLPPPSSCSYGLASSTPSSHRIIWLPTASSPSPAEVPPPISCPNWVEGCREAPMEDTLLGGSAARHTLLVRARCSPHYSTGTLSSSNAAVSSLADVARTRFRFEVAASSERATAAELVVGTLLLYNLDLF